MSLGRATLARHVLGRGPAVTATTAYVLTANPGAVTFTGVAATLLYNRVLTANPGAVTVAGVAANLFYNRQLIANPGAVSFDGVAATLLFNRMVGVTPGAITLAGAAADLIHEFPLTANPGAITIAGADADLLYNRVLDCQPGAMTLAGAAANLDYSAVTAQQLAELYGGNIFSRRRKKKEEEEKPSLEGMIEAIIAVEEHGKEEIAELLPKKQQAALPEPDLATVEEVVRQVEAAGKRVVAKIEALYEEVMDEDDAAALALLFDMDVADDRLRRKPRQERLQ